MHCRHAHLVLLARQDDERKALTIKFDPTDNTDSAKAGQSQKYLFIPESIQAGRLGNT